MILLEAPLEFTYKYLNEDDSKQINKENKIANEIHVITSLAPYIDEINESGAQF